MIKKSLLVVGAYIAFGSGLIYAAEVPGSISQHVDVLLYMLTGLIGVLCFFSIRTLNTIDENQKKLSDSLDAAKLDIYAKINGVRHDLDNLHGEHNAIVKLGRRHGDNETR